MKLRMIQMREAVRPKRPTMVQGTPLGSGATKSFIVGEGGVRSIVFEAGFYLVSNEFGLVRVPVGNVVQDEPLIDDARATEPDVRRGPGRPPKQPDAA